MRRAMNKENPVNARQAAVILGCGRTRISAIKSQLEITGRYFFLSDVRGFLKKHPNFKERDVYKRKLEQSTDSLSALR